MSWKNDRAEELLFVRDKVRLETSLFRLCGIQSRFFLFFLEFRVVGDHLQQSSVGSPFAFLRLSNSVLVFLTCNNT